MSRRALVGCDSCLLMLDIGGEMDREGLASVKLKTVDVVDAQDAVLEFDSGDV